MNPDFWAGITGGVFCVDLHVHMWTWWTQIGWEYWWFEGGALPKDSVLVFFEVP
jgi:hypothetical protein